MKKIFILVALAIFFNTLKFPDLTYAKGNPSADTDCSTTVTDFFSGQTGTRAEVYGCKSIGNSGEEQGIYTIEASSINLGYTEDHGMCKVLVKWSGDYGETPYLDFGTVFNNTKCSDGYVEIWGDKFGPGDAYGATPYVYSIGGQGSMIRL